MPTKEKEVAECETENNALSATEIGKISDEKTAYSSGKRECCLFIT